MFAFHVVMKQECSVIVRWRDFIIPLILLLIVSLVCQSDRELDQREQHEQRKSHYLEPQ